MPWFEKQGYAIEYAPTLEEAHQKAAAHKPEFILLENLRFFPGEKDRDPHFAEQLAALANYYVQDAFGSLHDDDTSMTLLAQQFSAENRTIGLLVEKELSYLNRLINNPEKPFVCILGGAKGAEKIPVMFNLLSTINTLLLGPAISTDFAYALQKPVGASTFNPELTTTIKDLLLQAKKYNVTIGLPLDYYKTTTASMNGPLQVALADNVPDNGFIVTIGPATQAWYARCITQAKTVFYNGLMGDTALPDTLCGTAALFKAMANSDGLTLIAGGDTVAAAHLLNCTAAFDYCSTGGGATLAYLAGNPLPGLKPFV
jgi:phosphoglycerate kinase